MMLRRALDLRGSRTRLMWIFNVYKTSPLWIQWSESIRSSSKSFSSRALQHWTCDIIDFFTYFEEIGLNHFCVKNQRVWFHFDETFKRFLFYKRKINRLSEPIDDSFKNIKFCGKKIKRTFSNIEPTSKTSFDKMKWLNFCSCFVKRDFQRKNVLNKLFYKLLPKLLLKLLSHKVNCGMIYCRKYFIASFYLKLNTILPRREKNVVL